MVKGASLTISLLIALSAAAQGAPDFAWRVYQSAHSETTAHRFFDRQNIALFSAIAATRALDMYTTWKAQSLGSKEVIFPKSFVNNRGKFSAYSLGTVGFSVAVSYAFHKSGHHRLERIFSAGHIAMMTGFVVDNFRTISIQRRINGH